MRKLSLFLLTTALLASGTVPPAFADARHSHGRERREHNDWRWHGDIHHFRDYDFALWSSGSWVHEFHEGREGWWWVAGGLWYFYPAPTFPYPDPYTPPDIVVELSPEASPSYYYCGTPAGYYPYVIRCNVPWHRVSATTVGTPAVVQAPPLVSGLNPHDEDYRQLNGYADVFYHVDPHEPQASAKLRKLEEQVAVFRKSLYQRGYNAMDVLRDAEDLKERIAAQRASLAKGKAVMPLPPRLSDVFPAQ